MDWDSELNTRFCWPLKNRARARLSPKAPRIPPVFTVSVSLEPLAPPIGSHRFARFDWLAPAELDWREMSDGETSELVVGCCSLEIPGQIPSARIASTELARRLVVQDEHGGASAGAWAGGVAPGEGRVLVGHLWTNQDKPSPAGPDWRIVGEQDFQEEL